VIGRCDRSWLCSQSSSNSLWSAFGGARVTSGRCSSRGEAQEREGREKKNVKAEHSTSSRNNPGLKCLGDLSFGIDIQLVVVGAPKALLTNVPKSGKIGKMIVVQKSTMTMTHAKEVMTIYSCIVIIITPVLRQFYLFGTPPRSRPCILPRSYYMSPASMFCD